MIRIEAGTSTSRFVKLIDMPERTWRRWRAKATQEQPPKGPWPEPAKDAARPLMTKHALAKPTWGHRKIWAMTSQDGHKMSQAIVLRLLRDDGLIPPSEYQKQRRELAKDRTAAFAEDPTDPNQLWQLDFSEFGTTQARPGGSRGVRTGSRSWSTRSTCRRPRTSMTRSPRSNSLSPATRRCSVNRSSTNARSMRRAVRCYRR